MHFINGNRLVYWPGGVPRQADPPEAAIPALATLCLVASAPKRIGIGFEPRLPVAIDDLIIYKKLANSYRRQNEIFY